jgi:2-polyprenyl-6-methoxyphenol hydroxylase-like FAD-dependent oxidoreductase
MKVLIAGGGIAGPTAGIALAKAGIGSEIYEAYPQEAGDGTGSFLTIMANGQDALRAIGAAGPVLDASFPATRLRVFDPRGTMIGDSSLGQDRPCPRTITRAGLSAVLRREAAARGVPVRYGKRLASAEAGPDGHVTAIFDDGTRAVGDLLIGADGIHSPVRALIDPAAPAPRSIGLVIACGYAPGAQDAAGPEGYSMYYGSRAFFGCTEGPDGRAWWFARIPADEDTAAAMTASGDPDLIARSFDDDATPVAAVIRATPGPLTVTSARDITHLPAWSDRGMIVIGDAAHPVSPRTTQGASLAIEDAAVLAECLRDIPSADAALAAFERRRREQVESVVRSGGGDENPAPPARPASGGSQAESVGRGADGTIRSVRD